MTWVHIQEWQAGNMDLEIPGEDQRMQKDGLLPLLPNEDSCYKCQAPLDDVLTWFRVGCSQAIGPRGNIGCNSGS